MKDGAIREGQTWRHGTKGDFEIGPCEDGYHVLLGGRHEWHVDDNYLRAHFTLVSDPAPVPADAAEVARLRRELTILEERRAAWEQTALRIGESATADLRETRAALNCGLTADERREPAILVTCRSRGAICAACELARLGEKIAALANERDGYCARAERAEEACADLRRRLKSTENALDAELDKAAAIRAALGCRDGETTLAVAKRVPDLIRSLIADKAQLAADVVETRRGLDCGASPETRAYGCMNGDRCETCETARVMRQSDGYRRERDAYRAHARANGEQRDRSDANMGRLLRAIDAGAHGGGSWAMLAEAQRIRDGGAPVDPRDAEIARLTRERDDWRRCCDAARAERSAYHGAAMAEEARANDAEREREAMVRALEVNAGLLRDAVAARDALVAAALLVRDDDGTIALTGAKRTGYEALLALLPAKAPAVTLTFWGPAEDMWS